MVDVSVYVHPTIAQMSVSELEISGDLQPLLQFKDDAYTSVTVFLTYQSALHLAHLLRVAAGAEEETEA